MHVASHTAKLLKYEITDIINEIAQSKIYRFCTGITHIPSRTIIYVIV